MKKSEILALSKKIQKREEKIESTNNIGEKAATVNEKIIKSTKANSLPKTMDTKPENDKKPNTTRKDRRNNKIKSSHGKTVEIENTVDSAPQNTNIVGEKNNRNIKIKNSEKTVNTEKAVKQTQKSNPSAETKDSKTKNSATQNTKSKKVSTISAGNKLEKTKGDAKKHTSTKTEKATSEPIMNDENPKTIKNGNNKVIKAPSKKIGKQLTKPENAEVLENITVNAEAGETSKGRVDKRIKRKSESDFKNRKKTKKERKQILILKKR